MKSKYKLFNPLHHEVKIKDNNFALFIKIETNRLMIRSIMPEDEENCIKLFSSADVMRTFAGGKPLESEYIKERFKSRIDDWEKHDPFNAYGIFIKEEFDKFQKDEFVGLIFISHPIHGETELSYLIRTECQGKGFASEAADAVCRSLIPRLMMRSYKAGKKHLEKIVATALTANVPSQKILEGIGFLKEGRISKYDAERDSFKLSAKLAKNQYHYFYNHFDQELQEKKYFERINEEADISAEEMVDSSFGRGNRK